MARRREARKSPRRTRGRRSGICNIPVGRSRPASIHEHVDGAAFTRRYVWVSALDGLLRFDGVRFVLLTGASAPALASTRPGRYALLLVDRDGWLWISRPDGALVQYRDGSFRVALAPEKGRRGTYSATEDGAGTLWFVGGGTLYTLRDSRARPRELPPSVPYQMVQGAIADTGTGLWIGTMTAGLWHVSEHDVQRYPAPGLPAASSVRPLYQSADGAVWVAAGDLMRLHRGEWSTPRVRNSPVRVRTVVETADGELLFATRGTGLLRLADGAFEQMTKVDGLFTSTVSDVIADADGSIWLATEGGSNGSDVHRSPRSVPAMTFRSSPRKPSWATELPASGPRKRRRSASLSRGRRNRHTEQWTDALDAGSLSSRPESGPLRECLRWRGVLGRPGLRLRELPVVGRASSRSRARPPDHSARDSRPFQPGRPQGTLWISLIPRGFGRVRDGRFEPIPLPVSGSEPNVTYIAEDGSGHIWTTSGERPLICEFVNGVAVTVLDSTVMRDASWNLVSEGGDTLWAFSDVTHRLTRIIGGSTSAVDVPALLALPRASFAAVVVNHGDLWIASPNAITRMQLADLHRFADRDGPPPTLHRYATLDGFNVPHLTPSNADHSVLRGA